MVSLTAAMILEKIDILLNKNQIDLVDLRKYPFELDLDQVKKYNQTNTNTILLEKCTANALLKAKNN